MPLCLKIYKIITKELQKMKNENKMSYDVYPCDLDPLGECPKRCQDCANCKGWNFSPNADETGDIHS
jgi:hypothetical protein